jgi:hypothetical protein
MPVVVLNHSIVRTHIAHVHRAGCKDIERDVRAHASSVYGPYETIEEALDEYIDAEMEELGYSRSDVRIFPCCK